MVNAGKSSELIKLQAIFLIYTNDYQIIKAPAINISS